MRSHQAEIRIQANGSGGFVDLTERVQQAVDSAEIQAGRATVSGGGSDCALVVNEKETGLLTDVRAAIERLGPAESAVHAVGSGSIVLPVVEGKLKLGTWQRVLLMELNGSADRVVNVQVIGE
jgi:secondary thiamine-phosphate synthase enzyme